MDTIPFMALKRLIISQGVPKEEANRSPGKGFLKELALKHGCKIRFA